MTVTQIVLDYLTTIIAAIIGIIRFQKLDRFFRLLFFQALIYLIVDLTALAVAYYYENGWIYNIHMPIETLLLFLAAGVYFNSPKGFVTLAIIFSIFLLVFMSDIFVLTGFRQLALHAAITEGIMLTGIYTLILYIHFQKKNNAAVILASGGIVLYSACSIPYLSTMFYFQDRDPFLNQELFQKIVVVLADFRYLLITIAFLLVNRTKTISK